MSATPVLVQSTEAKKAIESMPQQLVDAVVGFIRDKAHGCLEINFFHGGITTVKETRTKTHIGPANAKDKV